MNTYTHAVVPAAVALRIFNAGMARLLACYDQLLADAKAADALQDQAAAAEGEWESARHPHFVGYWGLYNFSLPSRWATELTSMRRSLESAIAAASIGADLHMSPAECDAMNDWGLGRKVEDFQSTLGLISESAKTRIEEARAKLEALNTERERANLKPLKVEAAEQQEPIEKPESPPGRIVLESQHKSGSGDSRVLLGVVIALLFLVGFVIGMAWGVTP